MLHLEYGATLKLVASQVEVVAKDIVTSCNAVKDNPDASNCDCVMNFCSCHPPKPTSVAFTFGKGLEA
ncbi:hypothetical protein J1N35_046187 [Gossypium stocksii]|uniref:Uncharacterized protein n=1 Tax=Gossypium stocksii TaxID=47602 RepID=A0A9D3ZE29_9ROSI|nr:hypothetical protein J1N35_046187 [Gossypium stocksii]